MSNDSGGDESFPTRPPPPPRTGDDDSSNPYASGHLHAANPPEKQFATSHYVRLQPHRGNTVLALGLSGAIAAIIGGTLAMIFYICCPLFLIPLGSLGLSIPAWIMGQNDLKAMNAGVMDPAGRDITMLGMIAGIVGTAVVALGLLFVVAIIILFIAMSIFSEARA